MTGTIEYRPRVLCVDDDAFMRNILTRSIGTEYEVPISTANSNPRARRNDV
jgi:chemotaxis response regulator CheB